MLRAQPPQESTLRCRPAPAAAHRLCLRPTPQTQSTGVYGQLLRARAAVFICEVRGACETLSRLRGSGLPLLRPHVPAGRIRGICARPPRGPDVSVSQAGRRCASGCVRSTAQRGLRLRASVCVYSPLAAFGKQNVSGKQTRAFLLNFVQRGRWLHANREHGHTRCPGPRQPPLGRAPGRAASRSPCPRPGVSEEREGGAW